MPSPYFSVIIPTLNEEKFLPKLLKDLEKQHFKNFEILIVDGGSTDKTTVVVEEFKNKLSIKTFVLPKKNVSSQRNYGAEKAKGKFLFFIDADTRISSTFLKKVYHFLEKNKALIIVPYIISNEKNPDIKIIFNIVNWLIELSQMTNRPFASGGNILIEKHFFYLVGGFDDKLFLGEDHALVQKIHQWGVKAKMSPTIKVQFNLRRMKKEGRLKFLSKSLLATFYILAKGKIDKKIFYYPMGGKYFQIMRKDKFSFEEINNYLKKIKTFFKAKF